LQNTALVNLGKLRGIRRPDQSHDR
jgi:hypothetical protein